MGDHLALDLIGNRHRHWILYQLAFAKYFYRSVKSHMRYVSVVLQHHVQEKIADRERHHLIAHRVGYPCALPVRIQVASFCRSRLSPFALDDLQICDPLRSVCIHYFTDPRSSKGY